MKRSVLLPCLVHIEPRGLVYFKKKNSVQLNCSSKGAFQKIPVTNDGTSMACNLFNLFNAEH